MRKQVTKPIRKAETILKKAEKSNEKLANYDEKVRDPIIAKAKSKGIKWLKWLFIVLIIDGMKIMKKLSPVA